MCPIAHVSYCPCVKKNVKLSKRCKVVKKNVKYQKVKHMDYGGGSQKKEDLMRITHIDVNFDVTYDGDQKTSKCA